MTTSVFDQPVTSYASKDLEIGELDTPVAELAQTMQERRISAIPIVARDRALVGVVSRTDLIHLGVFQAATRRSAAAMPLPARLAREVMTEHPRTVPASATMRDAAAVMANHGIHRVFVSHHRRLVGVIAAADNAAAVRDAKLEREVSTIMTSPIVSVEASTPLGRAVELLDRIHVTGIVVTDGHQPIGVLSPLDALACRDLPRGTPIDTVHDAAIVCLPATTRLSRAADHVAQLDVQRVVVCKDREAVGIVTGLDFARHIACS